MQDTNLTDAERLDRIKKIIDKNLFSIFTAFALDLERGPHDTKLESYVELKELLHIDRGTDKKSAINYDEFKKLNGKEYNVLLQKLGDRIMAIRTSQPGNFADDLPSTMFMTAMYLTYAGNLSTRMSFEEYRKVLDGIDEFQFTMG